MYVYMYKDYLISLEETINTNIYIYIYIFIFFDFSIRNQQHLQNEQKEPPGF